MRIFISHASEDKETVACPLAEGLRSHGYDVWYDDDSLKLGDSFSQDIDKGLANCDFGVVIISKYFMAKKWPLKEFAGLVLRKTSPEEGNNIILPIWYKVSRDHVDKFSQTLAERIADSVEAAS